MRANSTQKAYDEAFLACSTAVYFESQSNEAEALRSWRTALDQITYHNAHRGSSLARPASSTERALVESLRQLELQCKERVDLLETLRKSREDSTDPVTSPLVDTNAPIPPPHGPPLAQTESNGSSSWLGGGTIPPVDYTDLSRPPALPTRPSLAPRKSSSTASTRTLTQTTSATSLMAPGTSRAKESRTPSPEKKGRMLRTLRPGREGKSSSSSRLPTSMRSQPPDAAKAATQAWSFKTAAGSSRVTKAPPTTTLQTSSSRPSLDIPSSSLDANAPSLAPHSHDPYQSQNPHSRSTDTLNPPACNPPSADSGIDPKQTPKAIRLPRKSVPSSSSPRQSFDAGRSKSFQANPPVPVLPSYRNEYPESAASNRVIAASAAAKLSWPDNTSNKASPPISGPSQSLTRAGDNRARRARKEPPEPIPVEAGDNETKTRPPPRRKGKARGNTVRADLPPTPSSDFGDSEESESDSDEWKEKCRQVMKNLPRGIDEAAAKQILNEIVIQGDEVHWSDVAGLDVAKSALKETVVYPFLRPDLFMGLREPARGMLLFGPPGTGKTMLARAVATESHSTFFAISASSLTSKFLGESEKLVRALFALAKMLAPSIIFIDEIDSLLSSRSGSGEHEATRRIKTEFLIQWSDLAKAAAGREQTDKDKERGDATRVLVLAATNLPWAIDEAARRRFVRRQYIPLPEDHVRKSQVQTLLSHQKHELSDSNLNRLVQLTDGFSGSDITALAKDAAMGPLRSLGEKLLHMTMDEIRPIRFEDFRASLQTIRPSVSKQGLKEYEDWAREFGERGG
ncbi:AAA-domain-containing protein [Bimuria novae-zelandiae CBS 107.79]|uniref:AAA-domain-containing protein n=1 Tax=Bimuria novae-zelandiae CBS 107.79 TaxID=1447943 RepID=A0A6A5VL07_9PLEO|nr:AAA-domain-containing protein [Bimuria novae-zelandiae CBS 107.79]